MFEFLKRTKTPPVEDPAVEDPAAATETAPGKPIIAFVLYGSKASPIRSAFEAVGKLKFDGVRPTNVEIKDEVLTFNLGDETVAAAFVPDRYPEQGWLGQSLASSWTWSEKTRPLATVTDHAAFAIITVTGGRSSPVKRCLALGQLTALMASAPETAAVVWPAAELVILPELFIDFSAKLRKPEAPPLYCWVNLRCGRNADGSTVFTTRGLATLGHMEIEIPSIAMEPGAVREWMYNVMCYLVQKGPVLKDWNTLGPDESQTFRVRHLPSLFENPGTVIRLLPMDDPLAQPGAAE